MYKLYLILLIVLLNCQNDHKIIAENNGVKINNEKILNTDIKENINYYQFKPDTLTGFEIKGFDIHSSYKLSNLKIIEGSYRPVDGKIVPPDTEKDSGKRFLFLDRSGKIIFKSKGEQDVFLNDPFFYKNDKNDKVVMVAQLAYEYFMGGNAFLIEGEKIKNIGYIDVSGKDMETSLIDILKINEKGNKLIFSFSADSILLQPGSADQLIKNTSRRYEYEGNAFKFK